MFRMFHKCILFLKLFLLNFLGATLYLIYSQPWPSLFLFCNWLWFSLSLLTKMFLLLLLLFLVLVNEIKHTQSSWSTKVILDALHFPVALNSWLWENEWQIAACSVLQCSIYVNQQHQNATALQCAPGLTVHY